ncbi:MAG: hypothetical protein M1421_05970 [Candidatus Eremiobacteraeota bacterium]|nr:hypothetical protein [Candidatus Eremiobacteraeota bacterium]MCL5055093.1 hypothetical protein [Bacillota bacterium]
MDIFTLSLITIFLGGINLLYRNWKEKKLSAWLNNLTISLKAELTVDKHSMDYHIYYLKGVFQNAPFQCAYVKGLWDKPSSFRVSVPADSKECFSIRLNEIQSGKVQLGEVRSDEGRSDAVQSDAVQSVKASSNAEKEDHLFNCFSSPQSKQAILKMRSLGIDTLETKTEEGKKSICAVLIAEKGRRQSRLFSVTSDWVEQVVHLMQILTQEPAKV